MSESIGPQPMTLSCPHCNGLLDLIDEVVDSEVTCPNCGSSFESAAEIDQTVSMAADAGRRVAHFELIEKLGSGAFGVVWKARDTNLDRLVAVKLCRHTSAQEKLRFYREARNAAQLRHPNIVGVHDVGSDGDTTYIVSDYIQGATLAELLSVREYGSREAAELCLRIAEGLQHAHDAGIVHRDMKPGNIMLNGEGNPQIVDFGLARREAADVTMTIPGQVLGTANYMSPEQASGESHNADARSDLYSLGVILYQLMTGERPFRGVAQAVIYQVINEPVTPPRKLNPQIPRDLEAICLKAMEKEPQRRFQTVQDFAADLGRFLAGQPVKSRPSRLTARIWRWCHQADRIHDAGAYMVFVGVLLFTWAFAGFAHILFRLTGPLERPWIAWCGMGAFAFFWVLLIVIGLKTMRMSLLSIYAGLAISSILIPVQLGLLLNIVPYKLGGLFENAEARLPLFSLLFLLILLMTFLYTIALFAYYANPHVVRWSRGSKIAPPSARTSGL